MSEKQKQKQDQQECPFKPSGSSLGTKFLWLVVGVLVAYNIQLYVKSRIDFNITQQGSKVEVNIYGKFIGDAGLSQLTLSGYGHATQLSILAGLNQLTQIDGILWQLKAFSHLTHCIDIIYLVTLSIGNNPLKNETAYQVADQIRQLKDLESLTLGIDGVYNYSGRLAIVEAIASLPKLQNLSISLIHTDMSGEELKALIPLAKQRNLKSLDLLLVGSKIATNDAKHLQSLLAQLPKLDKLNLNLYSNKLQADGIITISGGLFHQRQVQDFAIELYFNNITAVGTETLMGVVTEMKDVHSLHIGLEFNYIGDEGGVFVGNTLQNLTKVKNLHVNAATKNFGWIGYSSIVNAIEKMPKLDNLELIIGVNKCGPRGADEFKKLLHRHDTLKSLKFNFLENYVGDAGATFIADGIRGQKNLEELQVNMNFNSLTDRGALELAKAVKDAKTPKIIDFRLSQNQIKDQTAEKIFAIIEEKLNSVEQFEFEFLNTALTNQTRDDLVARVANRTNLELRINTIPPSNWE